MMNGRRKEIHGAVFFSRHTRTEGCENVEKSEGRNVIKDLHVGTNL